VIDISVWFKASKDHNLHTEIRGHREPTGAENSLILQDTRPSASPAFSITARSAFYFMDTMYVIKSQAESMAEDVHVLPGAQR